MILINMQNPEFFNDACEVIRMFWGQIEIKLCDDASGASLIQDTEKTSNEYIVRWTWHKDIEQVLYWKEKCDIVTDNRLLQKKVFKRALKSALFRLLTSQYEEEKPWGSLTGIRPTKLFYDFLHQGHSEAESMQMLSQNFDVRPDKVMLIRDVVRAQEGIMNKNVQNELDIYIGIPFCPSRCLYCSFAAYDMKKKGHLINDYLQALYKEMRAVLPQLRDKGYQLRSIYIGGGTPTSLEPMQLAELLALVQSLWPFSGECTVEAGRPDTITKEKLAALKEGGVNRISINPQSMHDETLIHIGRAHTTEDIEKAFVLAREIGFLTINMDIIAGLPYETPEMFLDTLRRIEMLSPENVTVHTLAIKRASRLHEQLKEYTACPQEEVEIMVDEANRWAQAQGYRPYYLYRQKYMAGNLENVGHALPGHECQYNIDIMEETHAIAAFGAGAISKRIFEEEQKIKRIPNVKNVEEYIARIDEMIIRKEKAWFGDQ